MTPFVLIAGTGRSGTTWLGKLLDSSPMTVYRHEPDNVTVLPWFAAFPSRIEPGDASVDVAAFRQAIECSAWTQVPQFCRPPVFPKVWLRPTWLRTFELAERIVRKQTRSWPRIPIPGVAMRRPRGEVTVVIKSVVSNMRLAWIHERLPECRIVLIVRHPAGYVGSYLRASQNHGWRGFGTRERLDPVVLPLRDERHEWLLPYYFDEDEFTRELVYWIVANETPWHELRDSDRFLTVVYEELVLDPRGQLQHILDWVGLPLCEQVERFLIASTTRHDPRFQGVHKDAKKVLRESTSALTPSQRDRVNDLLGRTDIAAAWERMAGAV